MAESLWCFLYTNASHYAHCSFSFPQWSSSGGWESRSVGFVLLFRLNNHKILNTAYFFRYFKMFPERKCSTLVFGATSVIFKCYIFANVKFCATWAVAEDLLGWKWKERRIRNSTATALNYLTEPSLTQSPFLQMSGSHPSSWFLLTLHEVSASFCTYAVLQQLGCSHPGCKQTTNSVTTGVMIEFIRETSPSNAWQFEVKKHMEMPCSCAFPRSLLVYMQSFTADQTYLTACMSAPPSFVRIYLFIFVVHSVHPARSAEEGERM